MADNDLNLDWLISNHGEFLKKFGIDENKIITDFALWKNNNSDTLITDYFCELLRQASLYNIKNADTEEEFYNSKLQLDTKTLDYAPDLGKEPKHYLLSQIYLDKLKISRLTLPFKFDVQIDSKNCCSYCKKKDKQIFSYEKIRQRNYLPFIRCKNVDGCNCSYSIVPLHDENGKLIPRDPW